MASTQQQLSETYTKTLDLAKRSPVITGVCTSVALFTAWIVYDFYDWKSFGTGGTPPTWQGYVKMTKIRLNRLMHPDDLLDPSPLKTSGKHYLTASGLKPRSGPRPKIMARTMPQRQHPEPISAAAREKLMTLVQDLQKQYPEILDFALSKTEGKTADAIYAKPDLETLNPIARNDRMLDREIAHAHGAENSLHVWLAEPDARIVIEAGWGQRFPLTFIQRGWTMVYAPRDEEELREVEKIVRAGVSWITGVEV